MIILIAFFVFIFGLTIGSFLNVVILRGHTDEDIKGRSKCPNCSHVLAAKDLIPVLSYFILGGKCRYCASPISSQYPLVELTTGFAFLAAWSSWFYKINLPFESLPALALVVLEITLLFFFTAILIVIAVTDLKWGIIPDKILMPSIVIAFVYLILRALLLFSAGVSLLSVLTNVFATLLATVLVAAFFLGLIIFTKGKGMGGGDFKFSIFLGLILSWQALIVGVFLAFLTGGFVGVMLILIGRKRLKQTIAFGPFLALGAYIALLYGDIIFKLYLKFLNS